MSKPVVFVDTNCIDNMGSATAFLGNRVEIEKISKRAKIILPQIVFDELSKHVHTFLGNQLDSLKRNPHRYHLGITEQEIESINIGQLLNDLITNETIAYEVIGLSNKVAAYEAAYKHSIEGTPPFETNGDKGFKDTLIAKTVEEYLDQHTGEVIYLLAKDGRLTEYFNENNQITVIKSYTDFDQEYSDDKIDEYLIDRIVDFINEHNHVDIQEIAAIDRWMNWNDDLVGYFQDKQGAEYYVTIDTSTREPISYSTENIDSVLKDLAATPNFKLAHQNMEKLSSVLNFLNETHAIKFFETLTTNDQIYSIYTDSDIQQIASDFGGVLEGFTMHDEGKKLRILYGLSSTEDLHELLNEITS